MSRYFAVARRGGIDARTHGAIHLTCLRYLTHTNFPLNLKLFRDEGDERAIFQGETRDRFITYTRCDKLQRALTTILSLSSCNDAGANFRGSSARMVANFLIVVSAARTRVGVNVRICVCVCVRRLAWLCLRFELAICAVVKGRCERILPQVAPDETGRENKEGGGWGRGNGKGETTRTYIVATASLNCGSLQRWIVSTLRNNSPLIWHRWF